MAADTRHHMSGEQEAFDEVKAESNKFRRALKRISNAGNSEYESTVRAMKRIADEALEEK